MGKTVAIIVGVVAVVAIAVVAPMIAGAILGATASATSVAIATAIIGAGLSIGVSLAMRALGVGAPPSAKSATSYPQGTAVVNAFGAPQNYPLEPRMDPIQPPWPMRLWELWWYGSRRFYVAEFVGDCLMPRITDRWVVVDTDAEIRRGDICSLGIRDIRTAMAEKDVGGMGKRFRGVNYDLGFVECECTNPPFVIHTGLSNLKWARRVRATAPTQKEARRLLKAVRRDPEAYDAPLMASA